MPDARPGHGTPIDLAKLRTLSVGSRTRARVREGRSHPETGRPWKTVETEGSAVTEHNTKNDRVDAVAKVAAPIHTSLAELRERADRGGKQQQ